MKKKIVFGLLVLTFGLLFAEETKKIDPKIINKTDENYWYFYGFDFPSFKADTHTIKLEDQVNAEIDYIIQYDREHNRKDKYVIVGWSQGGLRAFAFASMLENRITDESLTEQQRLDAKECFDRLAGIITFSGIDRGIKALENNFATFKGKATNAANILIDGWHGFCNMSVTVSIIERIALSAMQMDTPDKILDKLDLWWPGFADCYIRAGWNGAPYEEIAEIYDMVPRSDFIEKNVSSSTAVTYKVQTGTNKYTTWEKVAPAWWWWVDHEDPVYTTYTAYKDNPKFSSKIPVGYIVGTRNNTFSFCDNESEIRTGIQNAANAMNIAQGINHAQVYLAGGFLTGNYKAYQDCCAARDLLNNVDARIHDALGSSENDGLVARESQYYPKQFYNPITKEYEEIHSNILKDNTDGYSKVDENHLGIETSNDTNDLVKEMIEEALSKKSK